MRNVMRNVKIKCQPQITSVYKNHFFVNLFNKFLGLLLHFCGEKFVVN